MADPFYRVVRIREGGAEEVLRDIPWRIVKDRQKRKAAQRAVRAQAWEFARRYGGRVRVYESTDDGSTAEHLTLDTGLE